MNNITVSEIREKKKTLRRAIGKAMDVFLSETDLYIDKISFSLETGLGPGRTLEDGTVLHGSVKSHYHVEIELKI